MNLCGFKPFEFGRNQGEFAVLGPVRAFSEEPESALTSWPCPLSLDAIMDFVGLRDKTRQSQQTMLLPSSNTGPRNIPMTRTAAKLILVYARAVFDF